MLQNKDFLLHSFLFILVSFLVFDFYGSIMVSHFDILLISSIQLTNNTTSKIIYVKKPSYECSLQNDKAFRKSFVGKYIM